MSTRAFKFSLGVPVGGFAPRGGGGIPGDIIDLGVGLIPGIIGGLVPGNDPMRPTLPVPTGGGVPMPTGPVGGTAPPVFRGGCGPTPAGRGKRLTPRFIEGKGNVCPTGFHMSKTLGCCVPNRRMNPLNPRALSRSTRRLSAFQRRIKSTEKALRKLAPPQRRRALPAKGGCGCK